MPLEPPAAFPSSGIRSHLTLSSEASVCDAIASPRCTLAGLQRQARVSLIHLDGSGGGGDARLGGSNSKRFVPRSRLFVPWSSIFGSVVALLLERSTEGNSLCKYVEFYYYSDALGILSTLFLLR